MPASKEDGSQHQKEMTLNKTTSSFHRTNASIIRNRASIQKRRMPASKEEECQHPKKTYTSIQRRWMPASKGNDLENVKVKEQFDKYFIVRRTFIFEHSKFNKRIQDDDEGVESFVTSLYTLTEHCGYNDLRQEMIRDRIVVGIKDSNLSLKMQLHPELTLKKATDMARKSETVKKQQAIMRCDNPISNVDAVKSKFVKKQKQPFHSQQKGCQRCENRQFHPREKCPAKGAKNVTSTQISDTSQNLAEPGKQLNQ
ncbi:unnamed protein product [Mytilus coruscus]|uniref:Retrotransposon gag domain-containing protein n=1 Tax=Mytilus coruscus TaxID=42192 RepID=A0A6J8EXE5_MYTCO|nr:unnamed protein product [Mytilus coruscus]